MGSACTLTTGLLYPPCSLPCTDSVSYTDISSGFFPAARERFKGFSNIDFATLDISQDPYEQGLREEKFDLIIAANVLQ